jgi:hypothetical protein
LNNARRGDLKIGHEDALARGMDFGRLAYKDFVILSVKWLRTMTAAFVPLPWLRPLAATGNSKHVLYGVS